jgi:hypothetical protein
LRKMPTKPGADSSWKSHLGLVLKQVKVLP